MPMNTPPTAGATIRARFDTTELRAIAFDRCDGPTKSYTSTCRAGILAAWAAPATDVRT